MNGGVWLKTCVYVCVCVGMFVHMEDICVCDECVSTHVCT